MKVNNYFKIIFLSLIFVISSAYTVAQEAVNISGGDASGEGGNIAFSVGLVVYTTHFDNSGSVAQGVQHAYEISVSDIEEIDTPLSFNLFPNPTSDKLTMQISNIENEKLWYYLCDMQGKVLKKDQIIHQETIIDMHCLPTSTYFINIFNHKNIKIKTFSIVKR